MSRRPYIRKVKRNWWLEQPRYVRYMLRELTSLFIGFYCALLVVGLYRLGQGRAAWDGFIAALSSPLGIAFQLVCLAFAVYHSATWFAVTPKAMPPLVVRGERVPARTIVGVHYGLWALISILVLVAARI
jgi:succinate dehydrogenase subunit C